jgi:ABC-2 type transport system ATP-binding protein
MEAVIKTYGVTKTYAGRNVVDAVNMTIFKGDIYGFIGSNGAGKTTFIRCLMGLITRNAGQIEIFGLNDEASLNRARAKIGCIVETPALLTNMSGRDCLKAHSLLYGVKNDVKIDGLLELVGLAGTGNKKVKDFSLGMRQRLAIAQALINDPEILILDEPTNGMDPQGIVEIRKLLQSLVSETGITILISSHILSELQQLATRFGIIKDGALIDEFTADELTSKTLASITISVSDLKKALGLISGVLSEERFKALDDGNIKLLNENDFHEINKLLVKNNIDVDIVSKTQASLEQYFIGKIS